MMKELLDRLARRAATVVGGGLLVSGDDLSTTVGVLAILGEFAFETWRTRRRARKAQKAAQ